MHTLKDWLEMYLPWWACIHRLLNPAAVHAIVGITLRCYRHKHSISDTTYGSTLRENTNGLAAAIARSLARGAAVYFSRPVRLFRPTKGMIHGVYVHS